MVGKDSATYYGGMSAGSTAETDPRLSLATSTTMDDVSLRMGGGDPQPQLRKRKSNNHSKTSSQLCGCCAAGYDSSEFLEYDYSKVDHHHHPQQPLPRIRERGEMYIDSYNDQSWNWSFGTNEHASTVIGNFFPCGSSTMHSQCFYFVSLF
jgi:hypothetical protein